jgi:hypothetical protein
MVSTYLEEGVPLKCNWKSRVSGCGAISERPQMKSATTLVFRDLHREGTAGVDQCFKSGDRSEAADMQTLAPDQWRIELPYQLHRYT